jgi:hypothetical protein
VSGSDFQDVLSGDRVEPAIQAQQLAGLGTVGVETGAMTPASHPRDSGDAHQHILKDFQRNAHGQMMTLAS